MNNLTDWPTIIDSGEMMSVNFAEPAHQKCHDLGSLSVDDGLKFAFCRTSLRYR